MFTKIRTNEKGFTLIELLIVVAIIGILAAIAIPQFSQYRIRGYNSAANSDIRNMKIAEEAFVTDWQVYASTISCTAVTGTGCTGAPGVGAIIIGPGNATIAVAQYAIVALTYPSAATQMSFGLSSGVNGVISTTAATGANYVSYTAHTQGNTVYGADSDFTQLKQAGKSTTGTLVALNAATRGAGAALAAATVPTSTADAAAVADLLPATGWVDM